MVVSDCSWAGALYVLVHDHRVSVRVYHHEAGGSGGIEVRLGQKLHARFLQLLLDLTHVSERGNSLSVLVPARVEGERVLLKHALEQPNYRIPVFHDLPILGQIAHMRGESELFIKGHRGFDVFDCETDRKRAELNGKAPLLEGISFDDSRAPSPPP